ncbi:MAG: co-chaperone GroES [Candidatus Levybacteria bacterium]|nr:co-chaperone GroES [Candidatus Levybacteria bacterium]
MAKINFKPLFDNVLIKPLEAEEKTASGIILPDSAKEKPQMGQVLAVGPGLVTPDGKKVPMVVNIGQKVMYKKWGGDETKIGNQDYMIVKQTDILGILD